MDVRIRKDKRRVDNTDRRRKVQIAHEIIHKQGYVPMNDRSEALLKDESLVAIPVCRAFLFMSLFKPPDYACRTRSRTDLATSDSTSFQWLLLI